MPGDRSNDVTRLDEYLAPHVASGALMHVLADWCPQFVGRGSVGADQRTPPRRSAKWSEDV